MDHSEGSGMHALSIAIIRITPEYRGSDSGDTKEENALRFLRPWLAERFVITGVAVYRDGAWGGKRLAFPLPFPCLAKL